MRGLSTLRHAHPASAWSGTAGRITALVVLVVACGPGTALGASSASLVPASGPAGTKAKLTGSGFPARARVRIRAGAKTLGTAPTDRGGRFSATVTVPPMPGSTLSLLSKAGRVQVINRFERGAAAPAWQEWASSTGRRLRWTAGPLAPGETLQLRAAGLRDRERLTLSGLGAAKQLRADRNGALTFAIAVPDGAAGQRTAVLRGAGGTLRLRFTVRPPAPFTPAPPVFVPQPAPPSNPDPVAAGTLVIKQVTAPADTTRFAYSGPGGFDLAHGETRSFALAKGSYLVRQTAVPGYDLTGVSCDDGDSTTARSDGRATAVIDAGETVTCTFTNTKRATIDVEQLTLPGTAEEFEFTGPSGPFKVAGGGKTTFLVPPGPYTLTQAPKTGYELTDIRCGNTRYDPTKGRATFNLAAGGSLKCTFTNTRHGTLKVVQTTVPADGEAFGYSSPAIFQLTNGQSTALDRSAGQHTIKQDTKAGYDLTALACAETGLANSSTDVGRREATVVIDPGETVTCTFTNTKRAKLDIQQVTEPGSAEPFSFTGAEDFSLSDQGHRPLELPAGTYLITQAPKAGYDLRSLVCTGGSVTVDRTARALTAKLEPGDDVACTFTNTKRGTLEIHQTTSDPPPTNQFGFTSPSASFDDFGLAADGVKRLDVPAGSHRVKQVPVDGYELTAIDCGEGATIDLANRQATVDVPPGGVVTCTFTNAKPTGTLVIHQATVPDSSESFEFSSPEAFSVTAGGEAARLTVPAGPVQIAQTSKSGYVLTGVSCASGGAATNPVTVDVTVGGTVECTFTNARKGMIVIDKETNAPTEDTFRYQTTIPDRPTFSLREAWVPESVPVAPGTWTVKELTRTGWRLYAIDCQDPTSDTTSQLASVNTATIKVDPGETVTCTFRSRERGRIVIDVATDPAAAPDLFRFSPPSSTTFNDLRAAALKDSDAPFSVSVNPGSYLISERDTWGWALSGVACSDANDTTGGSSAVGPAATFNVQEAEIVTCTFANQKQARLTIEQRTDPVDTSSQEAKFSYSGLGDPTLSDDDAHSFITGAGSRTVTQAATPGYRLRSIECASDGLGRFSTNLATATATLDPEMGESIRCTFTNVREQPAGPIRAAFYEPSTAAALDAPKHLAAMQFGGIEAGLVTWRGTGDESDGQFGSLLDATAASNSAFRWAPVYVPERTTDPPASQLTADLAWLRDRRGSSPAHLLKGARFVVFVPTGGGDGCATAARWHEAAAGLGAYIVMQAFPDHETCAAADAPDDWYAVAPAELETHLQGSSFAISPVARDLDAWAGAVADMVASQEPWQLVTSFNDSAAGTQVVSSPDWSSATSYGDYLDALHADGAPVVAGAGDIACDPTHKEFNGGLGSLDHCRQKWVSDALLDQRLDTVMALGDLQYDKSVFETYFMSYDPSWGRVKAKTKPAIGNHEYEDPAGHAAGYFRYFNGSPDDHGPAGDPDLGYYSYDVGDWHVVVLNSNCAEPDFDARNGCAAGRAQEQWLISDLANNPRSCTLAYAHHPRWSSGEHGPTDALQPLWKVLANGGVDVYLAGHDHGYERFAPTNETGQLDRATGIRSFVVGTGGASWRELDTVAEHSEHQGAFEVFGVLDLALKPSGYSWNFVRDSNPGGPPLDSGAGRCH